MKTATLLTLCSATALSLIGCNDHPLKDVEYQWGDGIEETDGATDGDDDGQDTDGQDDGGDDGNDDGNDDSNDDGSDDGGPLDCGGDAVRIDATPANVMLVLDKSGSMVINSWDHDEDSNTAEVTRWNSLWYVVNDILNGYQDAMNFGAALFPAMDADHDGAQFAKACRMAGEAEVPVAEMNADTILDTIPGPNKNVAGGTPATEGIINALGALEQVADDEPRAMILVTDGVANCVDQVNPFNTFDEQLADTVAGAYEDLQIPTYVVGIDITTKTSDNNAGVNAHEKLNEVAQAGGVARDGEDSYYAVGSEADLFQSLDQIAARVECTVTLNNPPAHPDFVEITIGGQPIERVADCETGNGWTYTNANGPFNNIELCGTACEDLRDAGSLEADYECPPEG